MFVFFHELEEVFLVFGFHGAEEVKIDPQGGIRDRLKGGDAELAEVDFDFSGGVFVGLGLAAGPLGLGVGRRRHGGAGQGGGLSGRGQIQK